ncbi:uncharacterized protein LOC122165935 isoform X2 [Centrocercus urophasianus]|uniref:uncharacterized protein LOC122165935 isoform X2 n=1 Tax=Centrocercus urophasianus TaxID=9002 RepID=UPI001C645530|nr:uncharacterized protein LOC122165935 isoform X2 [Centrocercus urophasianus]
MRISGCQGSEERGHHICQNQGILGESPSSLFKEMAPSRFYYESERSAWLTEFLAVLWHGMQPAWKHRLSLWILSKISHPLLMMVVTSSDVLDGMVDIEELLTWISDVAGALADPRENQDGSRVREKYLKGDLLQDELLGEVDSQEREQLIAWISAKEPQSPDVSSSPAPPCFIAQLPDFPQYSRKSARKHGLLPGPPRPTVGAAAIPRAAL